MNKAVAVEWFDDINPDSYVLIQPHYNVKILHAVPIDDESTEIVVYGPKANVDKFLEDFHEGEVEPFESVGSGDYDDEDYESWLNNEVNYALTLSKLDVFN